MHCMGSLSVQKSYKTHSPRAVWKMWKASLLSVYIGSMLQWNCKSVSWKQVTSLASIPVCQCAYTPLSPVFAHMLILFFCWDFKNWVLSVALVIQKLDSDPEIMVYSWQNKGQKDSWWGLQEKKNTSCSKEQINVLYFFKPHIVLMPLYITEEMKIDCNHWDKFSSDSLPILYVLCLKVQVTK